MIRIGGVEDGDGSPQPRLRQLEQGKLLSHLSFNLDRECSFKNEKKRRERDRLHSLQAWLVFVFFLSLSCS